MERFFSYCFMYAVGCQLWDGVFILVVDRHEWRR